MIEENGVVVKVEGASVWVETLRKSACDNCSANKGCGSAILNKALGNKRNFVEINNGGDLQVGDRVVLGLEEAALVKGSFAVYMVPLLLMILFALIGEYLASVLRLFDMEIMTIIFAGLGMMAGMYWLRLFSRRNRCNSMYHPVVLKKGSL